MRVKGIGSLWRRDPSSARPEYGPLRAVAALLAVGTAFLVARYPTPAAKPVVAEADKRAAIDQLLAVRAAAVLHHDRDAYLATDTGTPWRAADASVFDNMRDVPLSTWTQSIADGTKVPGTYRVQLSFQLVGVDPKPVTATRYLSFVLDDGKWLMSADADADSAAIGLATAAGPAPVPDFQLWDEGPVSVLRGSHWLVMGLGGADRIAPYMAVVNQAVAANGKVWSATGWNGTAVVEVPQTGQQLGRLLKADPAEFYGVAAVTSGELGKATAAAPASRVLVNPDVHMTTVGLTFVLGHELTHVQTRSWTTSTTPLWVSEGAADYTGHLASPTLTTANSLKELTAEVHAGVKPAALPTDASFKTTDPAALSAAYQKSWLAWRLIGELYGQTKLVAFYHAVGQPGAAGGIAPGTGQTPDAAAAATTTITTTAAVDEAFKSVLGTTAQAFTVKWERYVLAEVRG